MQHLKLKICVPLLLILLQTVIGNGQANLSFRSIRIKGRIMAGDKPQKDTLLITYLPYDLEGVERYRQFRITSDSMGNFRFVLPNILRLHRIGIFDETATCDFIDLPTFLAEPGDDIKLQVNTSKLNGYVAESDISGRGSDKYVCLQELNRINTDDLLNNVDSTGEKIESLLRLKLNILNKYRNKISGIIYQTMLADVEGEIIDRSLYTFNNFFAGNFTQASELDAKKKLFDNYIDLMNRIKPKSLEAMAYSPNYVDLLFHAENISLQLKYRQKKVDFKTLYRELRNNNAGRVRDKLLVKCLRSVGRDNIPQDTYITCTKDALLYVSPPDRQTVKRLYDLSNRSDALNFNLLVDSSANRMKMADFKGKVVLLDIWSYSCTACVEFTASFHQKVYPLFKDNSNFAVVSIMMWDDTNRMAYIHRLRGENINGTLLKHVYTFSEYYNLFAGGQDAEKIANFYDRHAAPLLALVDKSGKIIASTSTNFPFFDNPKSPNVQKLIEMISIALK